MSNDSSFLKNPERRQTRRMDVDLGVHLKIDGQELSANASNLSCGGMFIPMQKTIVKEKDSLQMVIHLPDMDKPVKVFGEIARVLEGQGVGVKFTGLYDDNILAIDRFIKSNVH